MPSRRQPNAPPRWAGRELGVDRCNHREAVAREAAGFPGVTAVRASASLPPGESRPRMRSKDFRRKPARSSNYATLCRTGALQQKESTSSINELPEPTFDMKLSYGVRESAPNS